MRHHLVVFSLALALASFGLFRGSVPVSARTMPPPTDAAANRMLQQQPGCFVPNILPGLGQWTWICEPSSSSTSARKRL